MELWTLTENTSVREDLRSEHGLSLCLGLGEKKILFDFGQTDAFALNAAVMGIRLEDISLAVLSHGHYDHGGGISRFLRENDRARIYVNHHAFGDHRRNDGSYIGLDTALESHPRILAAEDGTVLAEGIRLAQLPPAPTDPQGMFRLEGGRAVPEDFRHEQYLLIEEAGKRILLSGCSHRGVLPLLERFRPDVLIGGFHTRSLDPQGPALRALGEAMDRSGATFLTCHCTGDAQYAVLSRILGPRLRRLRTGDSVTV